MVFQCHRCFYYTKNRKDMRKHLNRKHKCSRIIDSYNYKEEYIEELSLINRNELIIIKSNDFVSEDNNIADKIDDNIDDNIDVNIDDKIDDNVEENVEKNDNIIENDNVDEKNNINDNIQEELLKININELDISLNESNKYLNSPEIYISIMLVILIIFDYQI